MKIKKEHYNHILTEIGKIDVNLLQHHKKTLENDPRVKDIEKRFRWDLLFAANSLWVCDNLYSYMDDSHIDTALKSIVRELGL
jgi:hypothetical protein